MERKGAVPIPYIIALLLGISVVAILGYWFFVLGGRWTGEATLESCRSKALAYCLAWQTNGYSRDEDDGTPDPSGWFGTDDYAIQCEPYLSELDFSTGEERNWEVDRDACRDILAVS